MPQPTTQHSNDGVSNNLRKLIDLIDNCRDADLGQYIQLPRICVVGTQSAGKSSLLEAIVGIDFLPRGEGVVTRRPLEMRLVHTSEDECYAIFDGQCDKVHDFDEVKEIIANKTDEVAGSKKGIVDDPIKVSIYGPEVPDLTLIDLPGITRVPLKNSDQTEDIEAVTKDMVMRYATDPRTVVLAVIPANQDISTSDALQIARNVDPKGIRTLGVITKIDIMDRGTNALKILKNEVIELRMGYIGVKLRSQEDMLAKLTIHESIKREAEYFTGTACYKTLERQRWGIETLSTRLSTILMKHINHCLPDIKSEIDNRKKTCLTRLEELGKGPPQQSEQFEMIFNLARSLESKTMDVITGEYGTKLESYYGKDSEVMTSGTQIKTIMREFLGDRLESDDVEEMLNLEPSNLELVQLIKRREGISLSGFPSRRTFESILEPHLTKLGPIALECLDQIVEVVENLTIDLIKNVFGQYPSMQTVVLELAEEALIERKQAVVDQIKLITGSEQYFFTNDKNHTSKLDCDLTKLEEKFITDGKRYEDAVEDALEAECIPMTYRSEIIGLRKTAKSYFQVTIRNLRDSIPKVIGYAFVCQAPDAIKRKLCSLTSHCNLDELFSEDRSVEETRMALKEEIKVLQKGRSVLSRHFSEANGCKFDAQFERDIADRLRTITKTEQDQGVGE
eukprot:GHVH01006593.1.p1 GENE.GHVH01006593.1~~GHVH01006593.1.p1  ORF type:complete len:678 (-),score=91.03 GHVH01006593.1:267-2300(-)